MAEFIFDREAVRTALRETGLTHKWLAERVGLSHPSAIAKILKGNRQVKVEEASKIYQALRLVPIEHRGVRSVPLIGFASAGKWREAVEMRIGTMTLPQHVAGAHAFAVEVQGDSMNLLIDDGGWVVIDPDDKILRSGKTYLLQNLEHEVTVKQFHTSPARFEPVSNNGEHEPFLVRENDFVVLGRVVWKGSPV